MRHTFLLWIEIRANRSSHKCIKHVDVDMILMSNNWTNLIVRRLKSKLVKFKSSHKFRF